MSLIAGVDYSTHAVDVVLLDEDTDAATWHRFELAGRDAFERARSVDVKPGPYWIYWDDVLAVGIEEPRGYNAGALYRIQGAILACLPRTLLVQPWLPQQWRKAVGLAGNMPKEGVMAAVRLRLLLDGTASDWPQDACDAYCIALATRNAIQRKEAA